MPQRKLSEKTIKAVKLYLYEGRTERYIMKHCGVSHGSVYKIKQSMITSDVEKAISKRREVIAKRKYKDAVREIERLQNKLSLYSSSFDHVRHYRPVIIKPRHHGRGEATAMLSVSDWHYEERVEKAAVNGLNEFNLKIAHKRAERLWQSAASLVDMCRSRSQIDTFVVMLLGDFVNGWIHDEFVATNELTPPEAVLAVFDELVNGLTFLLKETKVKELIIPCAYGNHSRITKKKWVKLGSRTNYDVLVYQLLARWFEAKRTKRIRFVLPQGEETYIKIYNKVSRIAHGDNIRYQGGIGGVHIPLRKAIDKWDKGISADFNYFGHWHSDLTGEDYRISGSLIGWNEYSIRIKAQYRPPSQAFEIQHPKYGCTARFPLLLDKDMSR
jgi:rhodanese-related sulfurtransferase